MTLLASSFHSFGVVGLLACSLAHAGAQPDLSKITDASVWRVTNRNATPSVREGHPAVHLDARDGDGFAWLIGSAFAEGRIDVDLRGANKPGQSFVGIAFCGVDDTTFDAVYFRPFNFKNPEVPRRAHSLQYISHPQFTWEKLRADSPGQYEATVRPVPDPDDWFHARVVVQGRQITVFVNGAASPSLVVTQLSDRHSGLIGLWVGNGSAGDFANLDISPR